MSAGAEGTERHAGFLAFIRDLAIRQARVLAQYPPAYVEVECPSCDALFQIPSTGFDQVADCPECGRQWSVTYDAECRGGLWQGGYILHPRAPRPPALRLER